MYLNPCLSVFKSVYIRVMIPQRTERVGELLKREISNIVQQDLQDPRLGFVTITKVTVTKDLKQANIFISIMGNDAVKHTTMDILTHAQNRIKELLVGRIRLRFLPALQFILDTSIEYDAHINEIISRLRKEEGWDT